MNKNRKQNALGAANHSPYAVIAKHYDLEYGSLCGDELEFILKLAERRQGPVLELGCGTGRVSLPLARAGFEVAALDLSDNMLAEFRRKLELESEDVRTRLSLVQGSMADFRLERKFSLIMVPFRAFQHLLSVEQQRSCLACVREHLAEDGLFLFDVFNPNMQYIVQRMEQSGVWREDLVRDLPDGGQLRRAYRVVYKPVSQRMELVFRFEEYNLQGKLVGTELEEMQLRWFYHYEAEHLFELSGLEVVEAFGGYDRRPLDESAVELIYLLRRTERN